MAERDFSLLDLESLEQGTPEWAQARCGKETASRAADIVASTKRGEAAARANYRMEIICERLTRVPYPQYVSKDMEWGTAQEPFARAAYEIERGVLVETVGFIRHPEYPFFGCSPDGLVGEAGMIQIKCPTTKTHLEWMLAGVIPVEHMPQMLAELACTGRQWIDFVSYDPRLPAHLQLWIRRMDRNDALISALVREVVHFNTEVEQVLATLPKAQQAVVLSMDRTTDEELVF